MTAAKMTPEELKAAARARLDLACQLIERAQNDLDSACGHLSTLVGGIPMWNATSKLGDRVKALWWKVHNFRMGGRYKLDDMTVQAMEKRADLQSRSAALLNVPKVTADAEGDAEACRRVE